MLSLPKAPNAYSAPIWNQKNDSDVNGSLWATTGIDLSENEGKLRVGKRVILNSNVDDNSHMTGPPANFKTFTDNAGTAVFSVIGDAVFRGIVQSSTVPVTDAHSYSPGPPSIDSTVADMEVFNNELYVAGGGADVWYLTASSSSWTVLTGFGATGLNYSASFAVFQNRLYSAGSQQIQSIDTSHTIASSGAYTIVGLPDAGLAIKWIKAGANRIWIGTVNLIGGKGYVYEWDGTATQVTKGYRLESAGAMSCVIKDDVPYIMDSNGKLLQWNGGTFIEIAKLNRRRNYLLTNSNTTLQSFIHKNGMALLNGRINLLINGSNQDTSNEETIPSGIWEYDVNRGLTCKHIIGTNKTADTITNYGQTVISDVGALVEYNSTNNNGFFAGVSYYSDATTVKSGIFYNDLTDVKQKAGSFITTKQYAQDAKGFPSVQNTWQNVYVLYKKLLDSADKIIVKYRCTEQEPVQATITWTGTTTFTVPNSSVDVSRYWSAGTGGEVEILNGIGAGKCAHITNAVNNSGTWTVTLDDSFTSASGTAVARFQLWKRLGVISYTSTTLGGITYDQEGMGDMTNWIQFKIWMLFTGRDEIEKLLIINNNTNPAD